jgi:hypothetical protein
MYCPDFAIFGFKNAVEKPVESAPDSQAAAPAPADNDKEAQDVAIADSVPEAFASRT